MAIKSVENSFGAWVFLVGVILAVVIGVGSSSLSSSTSNLTAYSPAIYAILVILGLVVGFSTMGIMGVLACRMFEVEEEPEAIQ